MKRLTNFFKRSPKERSVSPDAMVEINPNSSGAWEGQASATSLTSWMPGGEALTKPILCFNLSDLNFGKAVGVPNFTRVWLPHLVRHHLEDFELRYHTNQPLPVFMEELLELNGIHRLGEQKNFFQMNFTHFQKRLQNCDKLMIFVHDFHVLTIPWKYNVRNRNTLIGNVFYSDIVATYFPYSRDLSSEFGARKVVKLPLFSILELDEHCDSDHAREVLEHSGRTVFYPSDCQAHKNHYTLIKAFEKLREEEPSLKLVLTGFREESEHCLKLQDLIVELGLEECVIWHGFIADGDVVELYRACDIIVQASLAEGGAMIATEALSLGKAVCVADIPQARAAIQEFDDLNVHWFEPLSVSDLADAMKAALAADTTKSGMLQKLIDSRDLAAKMVSQSWA